MCCCNVAGVWIKDLRAATGLQPTPLRRILNTLESRGIIKAINSIEKKNRLVYMLANLEPNREITGGPWYSDQEFDEEFVKQLQDHIKGMVERQGSADVHAIEGWLSESGICKVQLTGEEIQSLVNAMVYDGDLEEVIDPTAASGSLFVSATHVPPLSFFFLVFTPQLQPLIAVVRCVVRH